MLWDGVSFHLDHFTFEQAFGGAFSNALLQALNQALVLLHRAGTNCHVVVFREHPGVEIGRHICADVHLSEILVIRHLLRWKFDPFLEGNRHFVITRVHCFGHPGVGTISANDQIHIKGFWVPCWTTLAVVGVVNAIWALPVFAGVDFLHQAIDQRGAKICRAVP